MSLAGDAAGQHGRRHLHQTVTADGGTGTVGLAVGDLSRVPD